MRAALLFNPRSGAARSEDIGEMVQALNQHGLTQVTVFPIDQLETMFASMHEFDRVVVYGGDGTACAAAAGAPADGPPLLVLPGGTMNVLSSALLGPGTWRDVLGQAMEQGEIGRLAGGEANGHPFFVAAMFGAPLLLAKAREEFRSGRLLAMFRRTQDFLNRALRRKITSCPGQGVRRDVEAVGVLCASMSGDPGTADLEWVHLNATSFVELARVGLKALGPGWRSDPAIDARRCRGGVIVSSSKVRIPATLDGEPMALASPIRVAARAVQPRVLWRPQLDRGQP